jgi:hypothetical protein
MRGSGGRGDTLRSEKEIEEREKSGGERGKEVAMPT